MRKVKGKKMTNYTNVYTYNAAGKSEPHDDLDDACLWLGYHNDDDETVFVSKVEFDENDRVVWAWDITKKAAEWLGDYWKESEDMMEANCHPLAETIKGFSMDWTRYDARRGI